tara:strand:- start:379 stop:1137 length:759 start_codon:yes stop_codon:yes gene_type:complete
VQLVAVNPPKTKTMAKDIMGSNSLWNAFVFFVKNPTPLLLISQMLVCGAIRLYWGEFTFTDLWVFLAVALYWPFQEWFLHYTVLHFKPRKLGPFTIDPIPARVHRYHHRHPWVLETTFLPFRGILFLVPLHFSAWWFLSPDKYFAFTGMTVFTAATLIYEWVHYLTHTNHKPRTRFYKTIWRNHRLHHFKNEHYWHSFTMPVIDVIMGTCPSPKDVDATKTCMTLGVKDPDPDFSPKVTSLHQERKNAEQQP